MNKNIYSVYGMRIESDIELPELYCVREEEQDSDVIDIYIRLGKVPSHIEAPIYKNPWKETAAKESLLRVMGIVSFYMSSGNLIIVEPENGIANEDIRVFLLFDALTALLYQRGIFILHGAGIVNQDKAIIIAGDSGSGKSEVALTYHDMGYGVICDEICAVSMVDGKAMLLPGIPCLNVCEVTLRRTDRKPSSYRPVRQAIHKYVFPLEYSDLLERPIEVSNIIFIKDSNSQELQYNELFGAKKFKQLVLSSRQKDLSGGTIDQGTRFIIATNIAKCCKLASLEYNKVTYKSVDIINRIMKEVGINE